MKKELLVLGFLFMFQYLPSQEKLGRPFFTGAVNFTLGINKNYTLFNDDGEPFWFLQHCF